MMILPLPLSIQVTRFGIQHAQQLVAFQISIARMINWPIEMLMYQELRAQLLVNNQVAHHPLPPYQPHSLTRSFREKLPRPSCSLNGTRSLPKRDESCSHLSKSTTISTSDTTDHLPFGHLSDWYYVITVAQTGSGIARQPVLCSWLLLTKSSESKSISRPDIISKQTLRTCAGHECGFTFLFTYLRVKQSTS